MTAQPPDWLTVDMPAGLLPDVNGPIVATGPNGLHWSRWRMESPDQFKQRVKEDCARLGITAKFSTEVPHALRYRRA